MIILLAMPDGALCVPLLAFAAISKYQVPAASPAIVYVVTVGLVIVIDWVSSVELVPYLIV